MKKISIIIPMYNVEQYISKCISSIYNQDLDENDFEIVLVDDESPDNSLNVAKELTGNKGNVKIISQNNKGLGGARNTGIKNASGDYLLFLDSDDWLLPKVLKDLVELANKDNLDILEFAAQGISSKGEVLYHITNSSEVYLSGYEYYNKVHYMNSACNKLYKRVFLLKEELFFLEKIYIEDFEFNTRCLVVAKRIRATDHLISQFLQSENSITRNGDESKKQKMISDIILVIKKTDYLYQNQSKNDGLTYFYLERLNFLVATLFYQLIKNKASSKELSVLKSNLLEYKIFYVNHKVFDFKKNVFRIVLLKNLWIYKIIKLFIK
jgi:glycosyltransferase involved in cell wall biosynthesis